MSPHNKKSRYKRPNPLSPERNLKNYLKFVIVAMLLVIFIEFVVFKDGRPYLKSFQAQYELQNKAIEEALPPKVVYPEDGAQYFEAPKESLKLSENTFVLPEKHLKFENDKALAKRVDPIMEVLDRKKELALMAPSPHVKKKPRPSFDGKTSYIAIVIDDVGMNMKQSHAAINLPKEVTLAMLPYAAKVKELAKQGRNKGHELIIHTPMEAINKNEPLGSLALRSGMSDDALKQEFNKIAASFDGYVGINNHMGSRLTQDNEAMAVVMKELKKRGLYFLDSKTIGSSVAADWAQKENIPYAIRDVFLDHESTPEFVSNALLKAERQARKYGSAIAIGHPKAVTMDALNKWIPTLEAKNIQLVPVSRLLRNTKVAKKVVKPKPVKKITQIGAFQKVETAKFAEFPIATTEAIGTLTADEQALIINPEPVEVLSPTPLQKVSYPVD